MDARLHTPKLTILRQRAPCTVRAVLRSDQPRPLSLPLHVASTLLYRIWEDQSALKSEAHRAPSAQPQHPASAAINSTPPGTHPVNGMAQWRN
ncbi:hypothetical protein NDU88_004679 [Pleurodeles waltl]|uniref:Uncharacterized protein n=1 Tax=Pleurodeles waltl TaxID=8319 RepID=A0AAV7VKM1_PLEWA|nr:hypothetical protein NDU88_004679 [Pleurodeles waltl]